MHWYLVHTKPRQEKCALENLQRQGFHCYLPTLPSEKIRQGVLMVADEPLFPRYLFIRLGQGDLDREQGRGGPAPGHGRYESPEGEGAPGAAASGLASSPALPVPEETGELPGG